MKKKEMGEDMLEETAVGAEDSSDASEETSVDSDTEEEDESGDEESFE